VDATGHSPVWPEWSTGFWQCKLRYSNQTQVISCAPCAPCVLKSSLLLMLQCSPKIMDVVKGYVDRQVPIALIIMSPGCSLISLCKSLLFTHWSGRCRSP